MGVLSHSQRFDNPDVLLAQSRIGDGNRVAVAAITQRTTLKVNASS